jgi:phosphonate transport system substrate-binding protein
MLRNFSRFLILTTFVCLSFAAGASWAQNKLVVAIQPTVASDEMLSKSKPLQQFLEKGLGGRTKAEVYVPSSYAAVVESLRFGHAHLAFMSAWPAQLAVRLGGAEVALAEVRQVLHGKDKVEAPHYYSYWIVPPDSPHKDLASLKGKTTCFPSPISTSGVVAPVGRMIEMNLLQPGEGKEADPKLPALARAAAERSASPLTRWAISQKYTPISSKAPTRKSSKQCAAPAHRSSTWCAS